MHHYNQMDGQQIRRDSFMDIVQPRKYQIKKKKIQIFQTLIKSRGKNVVMNSPEHKYNKNNPRMDSLEHFSQSQFNFKTEPEIQIPPRALPKKSKNLNPEEPQQNYTQYKYQKVLAERARQFINRLKKMKEYNEGKYLLLRRKQEQRKQNQHKKRLQQRQNHFSQCKENKLNKIMDNILVHEERICHRLGFSVNKLKRSLVRSKTQSSERDIDRERHREQQFLRNSSFVQHKHIELPSIQNFQKRLARLQKLTESMITT